MTPRRARRRRREGGRPAYGGPLPWLLSLPARLRVRGVLIAGVLALAVTAYAHTLLNAPPMPPHKAPVVGHDAGQVVGHDTGHGAGHDTGHDADSTVSRVPAGR